MVRVIMQRLAPQVLEFTRRRGTAESGCDVGEVMLEQTNRRLPEWPEANHGSQTLRRFRMARYVDGFLLPVPKKNLEAYRRMAKQGGKIWREHGALEYRECVGDDVRSKSAVPFKRGVKLKSGETLVFSWIVYKSRAHRDRVNAKVMKDPRITGMMEDKKMPFDVKRMAYGGFKVLVQA